MPVWSFIFSIFLEPFGRIVSCPDFSRFEWNSEFYLLVWSLLQSCLVGADLSLDRGNFHAFPVGLSESCCIRVRTLEYPKLFVFGLLSISPTLGFSICGLPSLKFCTKLQIIRTSRVIKIKTNVPVTDPSFVGSEGVADTKAYSLEDTGKM